MTANPLEDNPLLRRLDSQAAARIFSELRELQANGASGSASGLPAIPGFVISRCLGRGGGGEVFVGVRSGSDRQLAIKLLKQNVGPQGSDRRAWRELDVLAQLHMPGIPHVHDYGVHDGRLFIVTDLVDGQALDVHASEAALTRDARTLLLARVADAVQALHEHGVIHRDLKPANILIDAHGDPVIIDLGIATLLTEDVLETLTMDGQPIGSPAFMAPEQARGDRAATSTRSDVFALGATGFQLITGETPFDLGAPLHEAVRRVAQESPRDIRTIDATVPKPLAAILNKAVDPLPEDRYESAAALAADLRRAVRGEPVEAQPPNIALRLINCARRRPVTAVMALLMTVAGLSVALGWVFDRWADRKTYIDLDAVAPPSGFQIQGNYPSNLLASAVAIGDVTGDKIPDVIVGEPRSPNRLVNPWPQSVGVVHILKGPVQWQSELDLAAQSMTFVGETVNGGFGDRVGIAGDLDADGFQDLYVSSLNLATHGGDVQIIFGASGLGAPGTVGAPTGTKGRITIREPHPGELFGWAVAGIGDVTGDGFDDLAIGAPATSFPGLKEAGAVYVLSGSALKGHTTVDLSALDGTNGFVLRGSIAGQQLGRAIAAVSDFDGDQIPDLAVGAPKAGPGRVYVVSGRALRMPQPPARALDDLAPADRMMISGVTDNDETGYSVAGVDANGDGCGDLLIGASQIARENHDSGLAFILFGQNKPRATNEVQLKDLDGSNGFVMTGFPSHAQGQGDLLGHLVSATGDFNGDGLADFAVSAPRANPAGNDSGAVFLVFGKRGLGAGGRLDLTSLVWPSGLVLQGSENGDSAGTALSFGDLNGDGLDDLIVGAPFEDPGTVTDAGTAYVVAGHK